MIRISKKQIVTFPNFGNLINRLELLFFGKMPRFMLFGYDWFSTGHIHQLSVDDFKFFCSKEGIRILKESYLCPGPLPHFVKSILIKINPNLFASLAIFKLNKD
jgi:methionine biosynthesis protein MetW